jgi:hypothetical protein
LFDRVYTGKMDSFELNNAQRHEVESVITLYLDILVSRFQVYFHFFERFLLRFC